MTVIGKCRECGEVGEITRHETGNRRCRGCHNKYQREWYRRNATSVAKAREKYRGSVKHKTNSRDYLKRRGLAKFGLTPELFQAMLDAQGGRCAICTKPVLYMALGVGNQSSAVVDHCHKTGAVRSALCRRCNGGIGIMDDDPARLRAAADYIERHRAKIVSA